MRILWFTLTPCSASKILGAASRGCGWLEALERKLASTQHIELHISFPWEKAIPSFESGGVIYHPIKRLRMKSILMSQISGQNCKEKQIQLYMEVIEKITPDLIHVHGTEEAFGLIQHRTQVPVIVSIQGILSNIVNKYFAGIPFSIFILYENIISHLKLKSAITNYFIFKNNAKREKEILATTKYIIGRTLWDYRCTRVLAPNSEYFHVDELLRKPFYEAVWSRKKFSSPFRIVTVINGAPYKGFETILMVAQILQEHVGLNFEWRVIGVSSTDSVVRVARKWLGRQENIILDGPLSAIDLRDRLLEADVFCQVSHVENSPNSLCEAMIMGMPIVATFSGGTDSMLCAGEGLLVQDGDPISMAGVILEISKDFCLAVQLGQSARRRALLRHDPEAVSQKVLAVYKSIVKGAISGNGQFKN